MESEMIHTSLCRFKLRAVGHGHIEVERCGIDEHFVEVYIVARAISHLHLAAPGGIGVKLSRIDMTGLQVDGR